jgi:hypothetical protein
MSGKGTQALSRPTKNKPGTTATMSYFPKLFEHSYLTSPVPASVVPVVLANAAEPYWLAFTKVSDNTFRIRRLITSKNLFRHAFKSVLTLYICGNDKGSLLEVAIRPHALHLVFFVNWLLFLGLLFLGGLITLNVVLVLFAVGGFVFVYLILTIQLQIDSEIFVGFLQDVLSASASDVK